MHNPFSLKGKTILVTGASSGLGASIAIECAKMGASLVITGRDENRLKNTFTTIGKNVSMVIADLEKNEEIEKLSNTIPSINGIVFNAGINKRQPVNFIKDKELDSVMNINFKSSATIIKSLLKQKKIEKNSSIVFISSIAVDRPVAGNAAYSAAKGAIDSYMRVLALELANKQIRANSIHPGMVWTSLIDKSSLDAEHYKIDEKRYPLGRYGKPEEVSYAVIYLLSNASAWTTGTILTLDGGISLI